MKLAVDSGLDTVATRGKTGLKSTPSKRWRAIWFSPASARRLDGARLIAAFPRSGQALQFSAFCAFLRPALRLQSFRFPLSAFRFSWLALKNWQLVIGNWEFPEAFP